MLANVSGQHSEAELGASGLPRDSCSDGPARWYRDSDGRDQRLLPALQQAHSTLSRFARACLGGVSGAELPRPVESDSGVLKVQSRLDLGGNCIAASCRVAGRC